MTIIQATFSDGRVAIVSIYRRWDNNPQGYRAETDALPAVARNAAASPREALEALAAANGTEVANVWPLNWRRAQQAFIDVVEMDKLSDEDLFRVRGIANDILAQRGNPHG